MPLGSLDASNRQVLQIYDGAVLRVCTDFIVQVVDASPGRGVSSGSGFGAELLDEGDSLLLGRKRHKWHFIHLPVVRQLRAQMASFNSASGNLKSGQSFIEAIGAADGRNW